ncbi:hypothetical protein EDF56_102258 [Novosphingobium sp. PhB165]|uniref:hypothetical protein n=1 Tax=Novosphingobium sp. PhB165 TaxID=2485105 RepID=UPI0010456EBF|nr:hypothetical protein [Novosphingobium sp. PhB165]TCM20597.1 hypothetical protein EDF56_102258 [Novosphingobium sp. PhB165]
MSAQLPSGFEALEPFVATWALATTAERAAMRSASSPEQRAAFFAAAAPLLDSALAALDGRAMADLAPQERRLMDLMYSLAHVALAVEIQGPDEIKSAPLRDRLHITRSATDRRTAA